MKSPLAQASDPSEIYRDQAIPMISSHCYATYIAKYKMPFVNLIHDTKKGGFIKFF